MFLHKVNNVTIWELAKY